MAKKIYKLILGLTLLLILFIPKSTLASNMSDSEASYQRGNDYLNQRQYNAAINSYTQAIALNPQYAKAYNNRGIVYYMVIRYDLAINDYTKAIQLNPQFANAYFNRGNSYKAQGQRDLAIANYTKAIQINPQDKDYYLKRADTYIGQRNDLSMDDYNQVLRMDCNDRSAYSGKYSLLQGANCFLFNDSNIRDTSYNPFRH